MHKSCFHLISQKKKNSRRTNKTKNKQDQDHNHHLGSQLQALYFLTRQKVSPDLTERTHTHTDTHTINIQSHVYSLNHHHIMGL